MMNQFSLMDRQDVVRLKAAWDQVVRRISADIPSAWLDRFIKPLQPIAFEEGIVRFSVPGRFVQEWVRERYLKIITEMLSDELGEIVKVELQTEPQEKSPYAAQVAVAPAVVEE